MPHSYSSTCPFSSLADIAGKKVTVMGLGLNGGGEATVRFFARYGATITVTDMKTENDLWPTIEALRSDPICGEAIENGRIKFVLGMHDLKDFESADVVIKNPGVKYDGNKYLAAARAIESDVSLFLRFTKAPVIAVTGSKGKSSTVSAIHYGLNHCGFKSFLGGNITVSPLTFLEETTEETPVVLELSSWQLADLRGRGVLKPKISLITKIVPDHQNWYGNMESYVADKKLIYADQTPDQYTLCTSDDDWGKTFAAETNGTVVWYSASDLHIEETAVPGFHMKQNISNAVLVLGLMGVPEDKARAVMAQFPGIEHRLEYFHSYGTVPVYNDSAATVPEAVLEAVRAFEGKRVVLLTGGTHKGLTYEKAAEACTLADSVYLLAGNGTDMLMELLDTAGTAHSAPFASVTDMLNAVRADVRPDSADTVIVFSPGATSFGMFKNEFDRGNQFKAAAREILK
ncbi:MAG: UDP-N-acetylmuramoyl-L-alanine--D-glutamate ligase [Treponemataceae bacterium]|nr:UDP-N-acetylmuramoyl-L-alanine--D-glutamate ligase [Treponemataceae bacterium]